MPIRNQNWYNLQSTRRYPLDDQSTGVDDTGTFIRDDILVDCHIRFPQSFGNYAYVQGINVTDNMVAIVFGAADDLTGTNSRTIAVISLAQPISANVNIPITPMRYGVSGWVVFGPGVDAPFVGRYSTPQQTFIGLRNARNYTTLPIPSIGKQGKLTALEGVISIFADSPLTTTYYDNYAVNQYDPVEDRVYETPIKAIVVSTESPTALFDARREFLGPCSERPESGTCPKKPIERVAGIEPDCETGNINIVVTGDLTVNPFEECGGLDILTPRGLADACKKEGITDKRPKDKCCGDEPADTNFCWPDPTIGVLPEDQPCPDDQTNSLPTLPACVSFNPCDNNYLETIAGTFGLREAMAPPICDCTTESSPPPNVLSNHYVNASTNYIAVNIAVLRVASSDWAYEKIVSTEVNIRSAGVKKNGGIILNYMRVTENNRCVTKYVAVLLDLTEKELQIKRFDGQLLIKENQIPVEAVFNTWYKISAAATFSGGTTTILATLQNAMTGAVLASFSTPITDYELVDGKPGIIADASIAYFNRFQIV